MMSDDEYADKITKKFSNGSTSEFISSKPKNNVAGNASNANVGYCFPTYSSSQRLSKNTAEPIHPTIIIRMGCGVVSTMSARKPVTLLLDSAAGGAAEWQRRWDVVIIIFMQRYLEFRSGYYLEYLSARQLGGLKLMVSTTKRGEVLEWGRVAELVYLGHVEILLLE